jgi:hypothetical protein
MPAMVGAGGAPFERVAADIDWVHTDATITAPPATVTVTAIAGTWTGVAVSAFPDATNTGVPNGTSLTAVPGSATSGTNWTWNGSSVVPTANGVTITGLDINGGFDASSKSGITLKNSKVRGTGIPDFVVQLSGAGSVVQDCEIGGGANGTTYLGTTTSDSPIGVYSGGNVARNNTLLRVNIHHTSDGIRGDGGTYVKDSWVHTLNCGQSPGVHSDGCQQTQGSGLMEFDHCTMEGGTNDAIFLEVGTSAYSITNCLLTGTSGPDGSASFGIGGKTTNPPFGTVTITNCTFDVAKLGDTIGNWPAGQNVVRSGNVNMSGQPIPGG